MCARLDGERRVVLLDQFLADRAASRSRRRIPPGLPISAETRADAMRGVLHRRQAGPVIRPAVHVLLMARLDELELAQFALVVAVPS